MARVYDLVVRHFIASVSHDAVWTSTRVDFSIDTLGEKGGFTLRGKQLVSPGFLEVLLHKEYGEDAERLEQGDDDEDEEEREIPEFNVGETIPLISSSAANVSQGAKVNVATGVQTRANLEIKEKKTTPPLPLSESELITLMEKNGIGTDARCVYPGRNRRSLLLSLGFLERRVFLHFAVTSTVSLRTSRTSKSATM
jgi:DNA topoisomerase-3